MEKGTPVTTMDGEPQYLPTAEFGFPGPLRDRLVAAIVTGKKTATTGLLAEYEHEGEELPRPGQRFLVVNSEGRGVAVIETTEVRVILLGEVDLPLAHDEGEGFATVAEWRAAHEAFWTGEDMHTVFGGYVPNITDRTPIVAERFRLVEALPG